MTVLSLAKFHVQMTRDSEDKFMNSSISRAYAHYDITTFEVDGTI